MIYYKLNKIARKLIIRNLRFLELNVSDINNCKTLKGIMDVFDSAVWLSFGRMKDWDDKQYTRLFVWRVIHQLSHEEGIDEKDEIRIINYLLEQVYQLKNLNSSILDDVFSEIQLKEMFRKLIE